MERAGFRRTAGTRKDPGREKHVEKGDNPRANTGEESIDAEAKEAVQSAPEVFPSRRSKRGLTKPLRGMLSLYNVT